MRTRSFSTGGTIAVLVTLALVACGNDGRKGFEADEATSPNAPGPAATTTGADASNGGDAAPSGKSKPGVGYPPGSCNPFTCKTGCCGPDGKCQEGKQPSACGKGGLACMNCAAMGFGCTDQGCNAQATCAGCDGCCKAGTCNPNGKTQDNACGKNGEVCVDCTSSGRVCNGGGVCM